MADSSFLFQRIYAIMKAVDSAQTHNAIAELLTQELPHIGVEKFVFAEMSGFVEGEPIRLSNYNLEWSARYWKFDYERADPVAISLQAGGIAKTWPTLRRQLTRGTKSWRIMNEAKEFGLQDGYAFSIPGPYGELMAVTFAGQKLDDDPNLESSLRILSLLVSAKIRLLRSRNNANFESLTARETDALRYVAHGLNDTEIGEKMGISETTVHMHIENAKRKLGAQKRVAAVVEALRRRSLRL